MKIKSIRTPFYLRKGTSDIDVFYQVFLNSEYQINLKQDPKVILDMGANIGLSSIYFTNQYPNAKIVSLEPEINNFKTMQLNLKSYSNIICLNFGLWNKKCTLQVINKGGREWEFELSEEKTNDSNSKVECVSIKDIMIDHNIEIIDLLKIDIEGGEKNVFKDNYDFWLPNTKIIIIELHDRMNKGCSKTVFKALDNYDFSCELRGENLIFTNNNL